MAQLAIKGHKTRGKEVIEILEMLGGRNTNGYNGYAELIYYYIDEYGSIECDKDEDIFFPCIYFILEEFIEKYPYEVEDKVVVKGLPEYPKSIHFMKWFDDNIHYSFDNETWFLPSALKPYKKETMENKPNLLQQLKDYFDNTPRDVIEKEWHEYDKYNEIGPSMEEYLEYVNNTRRPKYPKTYEECCDVLKIPNDERYIDIDVPLDYNKLLSTFTKLRICRDAYWKIAGEQMGLDKPWEPDWTNEKQIVYGLYNELKYSIINPSQFVFPTEEMRDAFYENFNDLIEQCKELL